MKRFYKVIAAGFAALTLFTSCDRAANRTKMDVGLQPAVVEQSTPDAESRAATMSKSTGVDALTLAMPALRHDIPEQILRRKAYVASFNSQTLMPNWVAWQLTAEHADGHVKRNSVSFRADEDVDEPYRVTTHDYSRSGFDRGHMCPAGDNKWDEEVMAQSFLMTNVCPQLHNLNAGDWNEMENRCRVWARQYGEVYVVCGPIIFKNSHKRIGQQHKVTVPDAFFKVVLCLTGTPKGIGFIYRNRKGNRPMGDYVNSIAEVERVTGYKFFPLLPAKTRKAVENKADLSEW